MTNSNQGTTRRTFLKAAGIGVAGAMAGVTAELPNAIAEPVPPAQSAAPAPSNRLQLADPMQGTNSTSLFSRGNTLPIVAAPFGMAHWTLQTEEAHNPWYFLPHDQRIEGIRCTHQLSPWLKDYGNATFLPFIGAPSPDPADRASSYRPADLEIAPHSLRMHLMRYGIDLELAPTERCAAMRFTFHQPGDPGLIIDMPGDDAELHADTSSGTVTAITRANAGGVPKNFATYYIVRTGKPIRAFEVKELKGRRVGVLKFTAEAARQPIETCIGTSFISHDQAARNLAAEVGQKPFDQAREAASKVWEKQFSRVSIQGATTAQRQIFNSALYRASLFPRIWHEIDASGNPIHFSPYNGTICKGVMYADHGYWDVYRAWYPLMTILYPERLGEILQAWVNAYKEGGWLPQFPCPGYRACMTGSLIDSTFGDAAAKSIQGFDLEDAYQALKKHATQAGDPDRGYGRRGVLDYIKLGYVPADRVEQAAVETLDAAYGDFCIAQVARAAGHEEEARKLEQRSHNWRNVFDPKTRFMRGKLSNGDWLEPFDPFVWGSPYVEGSAWQHRFAVPHDSAAFIDAMGGRAATVAALDKMLALPPTFKVGVYGKEIHEMSEMAAANFGQYAHSNQPVHHVLYYFAAAGRPDRTQYWVRRVLDSLYSPANFPGDEDTGSMSAWYILSALGFYPLCPGKPEYVLGSPLFEQATLHLPNGNQTIINAANNGPGKCYVQRLTLNGAAHTGVTIPHQTIAGGAKLNFTMSEKI